MTNAINPPRWWCAEIEKYLSRQLDRLDRQPIEERTNRLAEKIRERNFPTLFGNGDSDEMDSLWESIEDMALAGVVELQKMRRHVGVEVGVGSDPWNNASLEFLPEAEDRVRIWLNRPQQTAEEMAWQLAVNLQKDAFGKQIEWWRRNVDSVAGQQEAEVVARWRQLAIHLPSNLTLRQLSAKYFFGDSKWLETREQALHKLPGLISYAPRKLILQVHLPKTFNGILIVENQDTFLYLQQLDHPIINQLALVNSGGFRSNSDRALNRQALHFYYSENSRSNHQSFEQAWFASGNHQQTQIQQPSNKLPVWYWGDLDWAGMSILSGLQKSFHHIDAWQPGYQPMAQMLEQGDGHVPEQAAKQNQPVITHTNCKYADDYLILLMLKHKRFVDQECVLGFG
ncbi:Wadjet anti-phage system protein JetD domain-containing protein [Pelagibaculum spongiae]|nr:Wadjet anti-phage system protein JetD domain-containing protein [Pelagibaculum spongiae]